MSLSLLVGGVLLRVLTFHFLISEKLENLVDIFYVKIQKDMLN